MFVQLHLLTSYPPANLNRDDTGQPKSAIMGGVSRLRVSSQSLKRAWRTSDTFSDALAGVLGLRTRKIGLDVLEALQGKIDEKLAKKIARSVAEKFGKVEGDAVQAKQLAFIGPAERKAIDALAATVATTGKEPSEEALNALLSQAHGGADIALFGRMLADSPGFNVEAAAEVAHAVTVHKSLVEEDFFTAVDDLADAGKDEEGAGAGFMGETGFGAGLFYLYICVDWKLLLANLGGDEALANRTLAALAETAAKVGPTGKRASFASRAYASLVLAERGAQVPRSLSVAFLEPVRSGDFLESARRKLEDAVERMDGVYGPTADARYLLDASRGEGKLDGLLSFLQGGAGNYDPKRRAA